MALALSLAPDFPHRNLILEMTFGVVAFSIVVQGLTMKPLLRWLKLVGTGEHEYDLLKVRQAALSDARSELDRLLSANQITAPIHEQLEAELTAQQDGVRHKLAEVQQRDPELIAEELRVARLHLAAAEKSAIRRAAGQGLIANDAADSMIEAADQRLDDLKRAQGS